MSAAASEVSGAVERGGFRLDVELRFDERVLVLFGPTGSGKSTIFELILGLCRPERARVCIAGDWLQDSERGLSLAAEARRLGWVPQRPTLFPHLSVERNLRFGLRRGGAAGARALELAVEVLELRELLSRESASLSGGEQQRVAIGRALASGPRALLLDEPLASLDLGLRARVLRHLLRLRDELAIPIWYITHDPDEALLVAERVVVLHAGREVASGPPREVLWSRAVRPLSQSLGLENVLSGRVVAQGAGEAVLETEGGLRLVLPVALAVGEHVGVGIRAEDVLLSADAPGRVSARNVVPARVAACDVQDGHATVSLEVEGGRERLVALVTAGAASDLGLREGGRVHALVKSQAIRRIA